MTYLYKCDYCGHEQTVNKPSSECATKEKCKKCGKTTVRVYTAPAISTADGRKF